MGLSKTQRMLMLLVIDVAFFLVELIVGYAVHSLALVADAFHMLNDVISLCISLWAVRAAEKRADERYTYGLQRSEVLGALINGVFLVALCVTIGLEAIQRFVQLQVVSNPMLILIVGACGLASNLVGLVLFHDHGHGHGHSHGSDEENGSTEAGKADGADLALTDEGSTQNVTALTGDGTFAPLASTRPANGTASHSDPGLRPFTKTDEESSTTGGTNSPTSQRKPGGAPMRGAGHRRHASGSSRLRHPSFDEFHVHPASFRRDIIEAGRLDEIDSGDSTEADHAEPDDSGASSPTEGSRLLRGGSPRPYTGLGLAASTTPAVPASGGTTDGAADARNSDVDLRRSASIEHHRHKHRQPTETAASGGHGHGHGHGHEDLNMRGVFLHVLGDALGNIGVMVAALFIWLTPFWWRFYADPAISLVITLIILRTALPLCRASARILLQAVPAGLSVDDVRADIETLPGVVACHHLHVWQLSGAKLVASLHVRLACDFPFGDARRYMRLARAVRTCLHEYGIHSSTIQPEFCLDARHSHAASASTAVTDSTVGGSGSGGSGQTGPGEGGTGDNGAGASGSGPRAGRGTAKLRIATQGSGSRSPAAECTSASSPRDACLLECDADCTLKKCCVSAADRDEGGRGH